MSGLTKAFVVFVTFLSVVLVALLIPFVANTENYREQLATTQKRADLADQRAAIKEGTLTAASAAQARQISELTADKNNMVNDLNAALSAKAAAETKILSQDVAIADLESSVKVLSSSVSQYGDYITGQQKELAMRRAEMERLQVENIQLTATMTDYKNQLEAEARALRQSQETVAMRDEAVSRSEALLAKLSPEDRAKLSGTSGMTDNVVIPSFKIVGQVTAVEKVMGDVYVEVNVGAKDQVAKNMKFVIHRNGTYLGSLIITSVEGTTAAGRMALIAADQKIAVGDSVQTGGF